uniref:protein ELFN1-like n=1 Tax=Oncorhynchus gorbuscha TaxID=8017 RepID=UPI001EAEBC29
VLQLGFNRLRNLTEGILRGLGKLQYLYLQANLIEAVTPNTFEECPNIENIDLSMNRIQVLDGGLFTGLGRLTTCELYTNPFNCSCELLGFLRWLAVFPNRTNERMVCDTRPGFQATASSVRTPGFLRHATLYTCSLWCVPTTVATLFNIIVQSELTTLPPYSPCGLTTALLECLLEDPISISPTYPDLNNKSQYEGET